ncbi:hypothetical protein P3553_18615 [Vibrio parahaemolyticus]|uniref:hypothetical protein n=1 Tax=Vibrio parahaemolyticus TaxID=670 RepID=UPI001A8F6F1E|nr:hypothetical protein [Vibrio parahaemolyticus]MBO0170212.1 hypothetical protein [Vibrio parahaemolyticus]MDF4755557.1 hypothetical protein [Vibrio parahaemolyticus]MDF4781860.1 hypothetical protein [Vibrio parahaemolyticus]MDF4786640.1 hypothetical protein [Vibrio parahaemolyticus]MDF4796086.1 hypothetical protein [Vibrio parahaemolyticus]
MNQLAINYPFVFLVDSPSSADLLDGYSIGMALRDTLKAIKIPCHYTLATDQNAFNQAFSFRLPNAVNELNRQTGHNAVPFMHLCMHGAPQGIQLTDKTTINWFALRQLLLSHNQVKGFNPFVCMASCNGIHAQHMATAFDSAYSCLIGNTGEVFQSDVTVAYASFYNSMIHKRMSVDNAVLAMRTASGDHNFYHANGEMIKNQKFTEFQKTLVQPQVSPVPPPVWQKI